MPVTIITLASPRKIIINLKLVELNDLICLIVSYSQFKHQNSGKDINLLINSNPYSTTQKAANLDLEKDRSHECKNSTEHLEKELPCKTSTLTKVKRTYI